MWHRHKHPVRQILSGSWQAGSKAELVMAIAMLATQAPGSLLTCNGYKDTEYMELVRCSLFLLLAWGRQPHRRLVSVLVCAVRICQWHLF